VGKRIHKELWKKELEKILSEILKVGSAGFWQSMKMAMDRPPDSLPSKMTNGENSIK